ncbi:MAG: HAD-IIIC family phosphatase [Clostridiales Family XIII bacterium]|jgi:FkbH-like protein|nr:HAD-IIIC family phosphatase [Clostridiales Family XIII bacterium]
MAADMKFNELRKNLKKDCSGFPVVRLAVIADWPTQFLAQALRGCAYERRLNLVVYEGTGHPETEILAAAAAGLYAFEPDFVLLFLSAEGLRDRFYDSAGKDPSGARAAMRSGPDFAAEEAARITALAAHLCAHTDAKLIVCNYCELDDAVYGSLGAVHNDSLPRMIRGVNERLAQGLTDASGSVAAFIADINALQNAKGRDAAFDPRLYCVSGSIFGLDFLPFAAERILGIMDALSGRIRKCLITDLDGTLWGGIVGDVGPENIQIGELGLGRAFSDLQRWMRELSRRGIAIAVCSKNDEATAKAPFLKHPNMVLRLSDISVFVANWEDKVSNIRYIRECLNIGFDSMVFIDDSPAERDLVRRMLPEIAVPELPKDASLVLRALQAADFFETSAVSDEDRLRVDMYKAESRRAETAVKAGSIDEHLKSLEMTARFAPLDAFSIPRAAQLTQRSNQFNLRTKRYTEQDLRKFAADADCIARCLALTDRFGDCGIVGLVILKREEGGKALFLDTLLMSCRVLKRGVEAFMFNELVALAKEANAEFLIGEYIPTPKNGMVAGLLASFGFHRGDSPQEGAPQESGVRLRLTAADYAERQTHVVKQT